MKRLTTALLVSMLLLIAVSGCNEETYGNGNRRAQLIGNENLRQQVIEKDAKISDLQAQLEKCQKDNKGLQDQAMKTGSNTVKMMSTLNNQIIELGKENANLKARIKELEK